MSWLCDDKNGDKSVYDISESDFSVAKVKFVSWVGKSEY